MDDSAWAGRWPRFEVVLFSQILFGLVATSCWSSSDDIRIASEFDPGCSSGRELTITGAPLGAGGAEGRKWSNNQILLSAHWGDVDSLGEDAFFSDLGLFEDNAQDRADFEELFASEELTLTFTRKDANNQKTGEAYSVAIYRLTRGSLSVGVDWGANAMGVRVLDGSRLNSARMSDDPEAVAVAYRQLIEQARGESGPVAVVVFCPPAEIVLPCRFRADAVYASDGSVQLSNLVKEKGVFVSDDDDDFFAPRYWADIAVIANFSDGHGLECSSECTEF